MIYTMQELDQLYGDFYTMEEVDKSKVFVERDELVKMLVNMKVMILNQTPSNFRNVNLEALNNILEKLGVDE